MRISGRVGLRWAIRDIFPGFPGMSKAKTIGKSRKCPDFVYLVWGLEIPGTATDLS